MIVIMVIVSIKAWWWYQLFIIIEQLIGSECLVMIGKDDKHWLLTVQGKTKLANTG